jgi:hypothetical protein
MSEIRNKLRDFSKYLSLRKLVTKGKKREIGVVGWFLWEREESSKVMSHKSFLLHNSTSFLQMLSPFNPTRP